MSNWPELNVLYSSPSGLPMPTYDINGKLIALARCTTALAGAIIARVTSTLTHSSWFIDFGANDQIVVY